MRDRTLTLRAPGFTDLGLDSQEFAALNGTKGWGVAPRTNRWFSGAGDGDTWRGARTGRRKMTVPVLVQAPDENGLEDALSALAQRFAPTVGPARLLLDEGERGTWWTDVVYESGLDLAYGENTNGTSWAEVPLALESGDPFWTRLEPLSVPIRAAGAGRGLLQGNVSLSQLRLASGQTMGTVTFTNPGDAHAYPVTTVYGPASEALLMSNGRSVLWQGSRSTQGNLLAGQRLVFDHRSGTVKDQDGVNRYDQLAEAPKFWTVPPGSSQASVLLSGDTPGVSYATVDYLPRRWLVV